MAEAQGDALGKFRAERTADWQRLEALLNRVESRRISSLSDDDLLALPVLYRSTLSSLSLARALSLDRPMIAYLEWLSLRAYFYLYGVDEHFGRRCVRFVASDWSAAVRSVWRETALALAIFLIGAIVGFALVQNDPSWFSVIVSEDMAQGRGPEASTEAAKAVLYDKGGAGSELGVFSSALFSHNAGVAILCFALGFLFGLPTAFLVASNGAVLGAFMQVYIAKGLGLNMAGWLAIHGTTEIFAILLAAAAGFKIGSALLMPGAHTRLEALRVAGWTAGLVMVGVVIMMGIAGLLEGVGRQTITNDGLRFLIGGGMLLFWCAYFYRPWRRSRANG